MGMVVMVKARKKTLATPIRVYFDDNIPGNVSVVSFQHGDTHQFTCPRPGVDQNPINKAIIVAGRYRRISCEDTLELEEFMLQCQHKVKCLVKAEDPSGVNKCQKRPLELRYTCVDADTRIMRPPPSQLFPDEE